MSENEAKVEPGAGAAPRAERKVWLPPGAQLVGTGRRVNGLFGVLAPSGYGKSYLVRQTALDPEYAGEVLVLMVEDSTTTYGDDVGVMVEPILKLGARGDLTASPISELESAVNRIAKACSEGMRVPKVIFLDSISGLGDYQRRWAKDNPTMTDKGDVNKFAAYWDLGTGVIDNMIKLRDHVQTDVVVLATTTPPPMPELCVDGKMTPKNFTRLTSVCLYMSNEKGTYDPAQTTVKPQPHRSIGTNDKGEPDGTYIDRFFVTTASGEVPCKGHSRLGMKEKAILADVLRKVKGVTTGAA